MTPVSVLTLVKDRAAHLTQLVVGLCRSAVPPAELVIVDMSAVPVALPALPFPARVIRLETDGLPLALARNIAARHARSPALLFLDVDCIPLRACLARMGEELERADALLCADIRYLGPAPSDPEWTEAGLLKRGVRHPARIFPEAGARREFNPGLFWSLAFAIRKVRFDALGGFDEAFTGYGAEDTDFGFRAAAAETPLLFVGGAIACHQYHGGHQPPVQHLDDILRNAAIFHARWGRWPMEGWLDAFAGMGLIGRPGDRFVRLRETRPADLDATRLRGAY